MKKLLFLIFSVVMPTLHATLPPLYQTLAEYKALIESKELVDHLDSADVIESIHLEGSLFTIKTNKRVLEVEVHTLPQLMPGPSQFTLEFKDKK